MKLIARFCFVCALLFVTALRLPAPIVEETPAPSPSAPPRPQATISPAPEPPKPVASSPKPSATKAKAAAEKRSVRDHVKTPPTEPSKAQTPASMFDGTWTGSINLIPARNWHGTGRLIGTFHVRLIVSDDGGAITEECRNASVLLRAKRDGKTMRWESAVFKEVNCSLTPDADGKTATVMFRNDFYGEPTATFDRSSGQ